MAEIPETTDGQQDVTGANPFGTPLNDPNGVGRSPQQMAFDFTPVDSFVSDITPVQKSSALDES